MGRCIITNRTQFIRMKRQVLLKKKKKARKKEREMVGRA